MAHHSPDPWAGPTMIDCASGLIFQSPWKKASLVSLSNRYVQNPCPMSISIIMCFPSSDRAIMLYSRLDGSSCPAVETSNPFAAFGIPMKFPMPLIVSVVPDTSHEPSLEASYLEFERGVDIRECGCCSSDVEFWKSKNKANDVVDRELDSQCTLLLFISLNSNHSIHDTLTSSENGHFRKKYHVKVMSEKVDTLNISLSRKKQKENPKILTDAHCIIYELLRTVQREDHNAVFLHLAIPQAKSCPASHSQTCRLLRNCRYHQRSNFSCQDARQLCATTHNSWRPAQHKLPLLRVSVSIDLSKDPQRWRRLQSTCTVVNMDGCVVVRSGIGTCVVVLFWCVVVFACELVFEREAREFLSYYHSLILIEIHSLLLIEIHSLILIEIHSLILIEIHSLLLIEIHSLILTKIHSLILIEIHSLTLIEIHAQMHTRIHTRI